MVGDRIYQLMKTLLFRLPAMGKMEEECVQEKEGTWCFIEEGKQGNSP